MRRAASSSSRGRYITSITSRSTAPWSQQAAHFAKRDARCPSIYDKATKLQDHRKSSLPRRVLRSRCKPGLVNAAVEKAFTGPCKQARKAYRKAVRSCVPRRVSEHTRSGSFDILAKNVGKAYAKFLRSRSARRRGAFYR